MKSFSIIEIDGANSVLACVEAESSREALVGFSKSMGYGSPDDNFFYELSNGQIAMIFENIEVSAIPE